jgi:hypothetical protein
MPKDRMPRKTKKVLYSLKRWTLNAERRYLRFKRWVGKV